MILSNFQVKLDKFQGPFDVLLHLIDEGQIDICEVSLAEITEAYLKYLFELQKVDFVLASEFLIVAAYLIEMKSKSLLPASEVEKEKLEESVEEALLAHLEEYKLFKRAAEGLADRRELFQKIYSRYQFVESPKLEPEIYLSDVSLRDLVVAFQRLWDEVEKREEGEKIEGEIITVADKVKEIMESIRLHPGGINFRSFFKRMIKLEIIVTFLALLELIKQKIIRIKQEGVFGDIFIFSTCH